MTRNETAAPTSVSLFSGAGGLDIGLAAAGFDVRYESDIDGASCETLRSNSGVARKLGLRGLVDPYVEEADVRELSGREILRKANLGTDELDVLVGGPPCQAFSVFGKRGGKADIRGQLSFEYSRLLCELEPKAFLFENVYGLLTVQGGEVFAEVLKELSSPGNGAKYDVTWTRVNARDFGVPQSRDRILIVGTRSDLGRSAMEFKLEPTFRDPRSPGDLPTWRTAADALRNLPRLGSSSASTVANHRGRKHGEVVENRYANLGPGERDSKTRINRLDPTRPSFTIVVGSDAGGGKGHVHHIEPRELTPRESARIQTFPDSWEFVGSVRDVIRQVGNAVPPLLGFAIGNALRTTFLDLDAVPLSNAIGAIRQEHLFRDPAELESV